jgi:hypothetical protein
MEEDDEGGRGRASSLERPVGEEETGWCGGSQELRMIGLGFMQLSASVSTYWGRLFSSTDGCGHDDVVWLFSFNNCMLTLASMMRYRSISMGKISVPCKIETRVDLMQ